MAIKTLLTALGLMVAIALAGATPAAADSDLSAYYVACTEDPALAETLQFAQDGMEAGRERFCSCMVDQLAPNISQADAEIYAKFVAGTMTDDDRMKHETFEDLHAFVTEREGNCMVLEGFADGYDPGADPQPEPEVDVGTNYVQLDTDAYNAACMSTDWDDQRIKTDADQSTLCECMTRNLEMAYTQDELDTVTAWYNGELDFDALPEFITGVHDQNATDCLGGL